VHYQGQSLSVCAESKACVLRMMLFADVCVRLLFVRLLVVYACYFYACYLYACCLCTPLFVYAAEAVAPSRVLVCMCSATISRFGVYVQCHLLAFWCVCAVPPSRVLVCMCRGTTECHNFRPYLLPICVFFYCLSSIVDCVTSCFISCTQHTLFYSTNARTLTHIHTDTYTRTLPSPSPPPTQTLTKYPAHLQTHPLICRPCSPCSLTRSLTLLSHSALSPCSFTLLSHPALSPCSLTRSLTLLSPCSLTLLSHPALSPCSLTLLSHPLSHPALSPCSLTLLSHPALTLLICRPTQGAC